ncbi:MAG: ABC transporter ATP-binding protein [Arthrobacter sp.]|nr:ABC transporter ATP-binding protein [Arthrobacter sp.]
MMTEARTAALPSGERSPATEVAPILEVRDLAIDTGTSRGPMRLVENVNLSIRPGERLALVGESGSGKSVTARAIMQLDPSMRLTGSVRFAGTELLGLPERSLRSYRGSRLSMVFQDPLRSLNPTMTIGEQVAEPLRIRGVSRREAWRRAQATLDQLGVANAGHRMRSYPFEFSGGMRQRVALAIALVAEPALLIADEPTTALDTRVQDRVLKLMDTIALERGLAVILITHDLGVVAGFADRVAVMYSGRLIEEAPVDDLYRAPKHPYTRGLLDAVPRLDTDARTLAAMPGTPVSPDARPPGCAFADRCPVRVDDCLSVRPVLLPMADAAHAVACHFPIERESK